ncbi:hypothetical protein ACWDYH_31125 [Nocardia goodfellowii]
MKYTTAARMAEELGLRDQIERRLRPPRIEIDGVKRYYRRQASDTLGHTTWTDPTPQDVVVAADVLLAQVRSLRSAKLTPTNVIVPDWQRHRGTQDERYDEFRATVRDVHDLLEQVREDADIAGVEWTTVAKADFHIRSSLSGLLRTTAGRLHERIESAVAAAWVLGRTAEAVHSHGCLLGATRTSRSSWGYSACDGGELWVKLRVYDEEITVTAAGCARHAATEIVFHDCDVEFGEVVVEILGGTDADWDAIYALADVVRRERNRVVRERENNRTGSYILPSPPWMQRGIGDN